MEARVLGHGESTVDDPARRVRCHCRVDEMVSSSWAVGEDLGRLLLAGPVDRSEPALLCSPTARPLGLATGLTTGRCRNCFARLRRLRHHASW